MKQVLINLTNEKLIDLQTSLLNLGHNFLPISKNVPFMDIISATESKTGLDITSQNKGTDAKPLRRKVKYM